VDLLDEAVAASLLQEGSGRAERFTFTHVLVEHFVRTSAAHAATGCTSG
jgi:hypothetical protein